MCINRDEEDSSTKFKVANRKYITTDMICADSSIECVTIGTKTFTRTDSKESYKNHSNNSHSNSYNNAGQLLVDLWPLDKRAISNYSQVLHFITQFNAAIEEFAQKESVKYSNDYIITTPIPTEEYLSETIGKLYNQKYYLTRCYRYEYDLQLALLAECGTEDNIRLLLFLANRTKAKTTNEVNSHYPRTKHTHTTEDSSSSKTDSLPEIDIVKAFQQRYGGQFVGNGYNFLLYHLKVFYLVSNLILASGYQSEPSKWGALSPDNSNSKGYLLRNVQTDCDFLTFIPKWREHFKDFMIDKESTMMLLRKILRFIYLIKLVCNYYQLEEHKKLGEIEIFHICSAFNLKDPTWK